MSMFLSALPSFIDGEIIGKFLRLKVGVAVEFEGVWKRGLQGAQANFNSLILEWVLQKKLRGEEWRVIRTEVRREGGGVDVLGSE